MICNTITMGSNLNTKFVLQRKEQFEPGVEIKMSIVLSYLSIIYILGMYSSKLEKR